MKILVIAAHPDDEVLGCGGAILRHVANGDEVHVAIMAEGVTSRYLQRDTTSNSDELSKLAQAAHEANKCLGVKSLELYEFPDNRMDSLERLDVIKVVEGMINKIMPEIVYTHHCGDVNIDHRIVHEAVYTACRPVPESSVKTLLFFEVPSSTEWIPAGSATPFIPNWYVDISYYLDKKLMALRIYNSEMRKWPHTRSLEAVEHLSKWRGATIGKIAAEAFVLGRHISC
jgi:N-acetylglucosamine malate deacetylase 1